MSAVPWIVTLPDRSLPSVGNVKVADGFWHPLESRTASGSAVAAGAASNGAGVEGVAGRETVGKEVGRKAAGTAGLSTVAARKVIPATSTTQTPITPARVIRRRARSRS